jgi:hypothetical protein
MRGLSVVSLYRTTGRATTPRPGLTMCTRKSSRGKENFGHWGFRHVALLVVASLWTSYAAAQTPVTAGYKDFAYGSSVATAPTGEKPESKLWWNDGSWWGDLYSSTAHAYHIYRLHPTSQSWTDTGMRCIMPRRVRMSAKRAKVNRAA